MRTKKVQPLKISERIPKAKLPSLTKKQKVKKVAYGLPQYGMP